MKNFSHLLMQLFFIFITTTCISAQPTRTVIFAGQWPFHPTKAIDIDTNRGLIFLGDANLICVLDEQFNLMSILPVSDNAEIGGIFYVESDRTLYVASISDGLWIFDVSDPLAPFKKGAFLPETIQTDTYGVYVSDSIAYLSCGISDLLMVDVSDPGNTNLLAEVNLPGAYNITFSVDAFISQGYAFVADLYNGVHIINVMDRQQPEPKRVISLPGARDLFVDDHYLFASLEGGGIEIINIADPESPTEASLYLTDAQPRAVKVNDNFAYVAYNQAGLHMIDITNKTIPIHDSAWEYTKTGAKSIALDKQNKFAYITDDRVGLQKINIVNPAEMTQTAKFDTPADALSIEVYGNYVFTLDNITGDKPENEGLRILQINEINRTIQLDLTGFITTPGHANDLFVIGNHAYVADGESGLQIIDISDKTNPSLAGSVNSMGTATGVHVVNEIAYISDGDHGITIIDISNPAMPILISNLETTGFSHSLFVDENFAYIADGKNGLVIVDVSDPYSPRIVGIREIPEGTAKGIIVDDDYAFVAAGHQGLSVVNIENKTTPQIVGGSVTPGFAERIRISGDFAYVADGPNGVTVLDISDPANPLIVPEWSYDTTGYTSDIVSGYSVEDTLFAFAADGPAGVIVINPTFKDEDISDDTPGSSSSGGCFIHVIR